MATDVDVQFFSHLNGLTLGNNWGDLIRLLDKTLVTGLDFTQITAASIDTQGDVHITLYAAHNAMLFQVVELSGFTPASLNQKYRIKGVPSATELILKPHAAIVETNITTVGAGKLASLGYEIIFRDTNDVKRVYRAKNPTAQHPFIRVDESLTSPDGASGVYNPSYAKSAMVGLLENMTHIDDYQDTSKLQLPLDTSDFSKNWKIAGTGTSVVRGWCKWYWATNSSATSVTESGIASNGLRNFTLVGCSDYFYLVQAFDISTPKSKLVYGCGLFNTSLPNDILPNWFVMATQKASSASDWAGINRSSPGYSPLAYSDATSGFMTAKYDVLNPIKNSATARGLLQNYISGVQKLYENNIAALEIPIVDEYLRGTLPCVAWSGNIINTNEKTTPLIADQAMYITDSVMVSGSGSFGGFYFYLGEL